MSEPEYQAALGVTLARIEMKLDESIRIGGDHETRLRALEHARWPLPALSALMSVAAIIVAVIPIMR